MQIVTNNRRWAGLFAAFVLHLTSCSDSEDCSATGSCLTEPKTEDGASELDSSVIVPVVSSMDAGGGSGAAPVTPEVDAGSEKDPVVIFIEECGDGLRTGEEACDEGLEFNQGAYGGCNPNCTKAPFCGDGEITDDETCDTETAEGEACDDSCGVSPVCGDGKRTGAEECDRGEEANTGAYGGCTAECKLAAHCGDGELDVANEQCDLGAAMNLGDYGGCQGNCTKAPYCGDGTKSHGEECDEGASGNDGSFGGCKADCTLAPLCDEPGGQTQCGTSCAELLTDEANCGECGEKCPNNYACEMGECRILCPGGTRCSNDLCVDTTSDINYCGGCDVSTCQAPPANGDAICNKSTCGIDCFDNFTNCGNACYDLNNDVNKCGTSCNDAVACKGPAQHGSVDCENGKCEIDCDNGFTECDGNCYDLDDDVLHCGKCAPCAEKPNTRVECGGGACRYTCDKNPLSCGTSSAPACGVWDFESGTTEGWTLVAFTSDAATGLSVSTAEHTLNSSSLAIAVESGNADRWAAVSFTPCPNAAVSTATRLEFDIFITPSWREGNDSIADISAYVDKFNADQTSINAEFYNFDWTGWSRVSVATQGAAILRLRFCFSDMPDNWTGTIHIDHVTLR